LGGFFFNAETQRRRDSQSSGDVPDKNVVNVEVLPVINFNTQLKTGNIGTGNTSTLATLKNLCVALRLYASAFKSTAAFRLIGFASSFARFPVSSPSCQHTIFMPPKSLMARI
jgi:hypothetical protein